MKAPAAKSSKKTYKEYWRLRSPSGNIIYVSKSRKIWAEIDVPAIQYVDKASLDWENYPDGSNIDGGKSFTKHWRIKNTGNTTWNSNYKLEYVSGELSTSHSK